MRRIVLSLLLVFAVAWHAPGKAADVISPEEVLGFRVGADRKLADWQQIVSYFEKLDQASDRMLVQRLGTTTLNNSFILAILSDPKNLTELETYRQIQKTLADPRKLKGSPEELISRGKTVVLVTCTIHSTEVAAAQMSMEFAHDLATGSDSDTQEILRNVIFLFVPSLNPDGVNIVNHWYWQTLGTPAEGTDPPELYHSYTGHDNNRDWYMLTQKETRIAVEKIHNAWHPQIVYDVHQMGRTGARIFVPPFIDPVEPNVDPILQAQIVKLGSAMFSSLLEAGKTGVVTNAIYDAFTPARAYQHYHGGVRILSEAASARLASPVSVSFDELTAGRDYDARKVSWNFPVPWPGGTWRLRDIVDYEKIALKACLLHAARYREAWLRNFHQIGIKAVHRSEPYAFVLPADQRDPQSVSDVLQVLDFALVEVHQAEEAFEVGESQLVSAPVGTRDRRSFPAGSFVVPMNQPYGAFAKAMLEIQRYPELREYPGGPLKRPYDVTAHTLGTQLGVEIHQINKPFQTALRRLEKVEVPAGSVNGEGNYWLFSHTNNAFAKLANRLLKKGYTVSWAPNGFQVEGKGFPVGTLMASGGGIAAGMTELLQDLPVQVERFKSWPELAWQRIRLPRIGLYKSYEPSMDEGWTRWILEGYEFPYTSLYNSDIQKGKLESFDVIVFPEQSPSGIKNGRSEPYPEQYRGGVGDEGLARLKAFAEQGGTLVFLGEATRLPIEAWNLAAKDLTQGVSRNEFYIPGSFLRVRVHNRHPIGYGMPEEAAVMFESSPMFELSGGLPVVRYSAEDVLLSGWADGEERLLGKTALAEFLMGKGRVILIGFRTQFRAQTRGTYKFLFNSLYYATIK